MSQNPTMVINQQLADLLGVPWKDRRVTGFTLHVQAGERPRLVVRHFAPVDQPHPAVARFTLLPLPEAAAPAEPALPDLEAMAQAARERVALHIGSVARRHMDAIKWAFIKADCRLWRAHDEAAARASCNNTRRAAT